jgi:hypothetical protein
MVIWIFSDPFIDYYVHFRNQVTTESLAMKLEKGTYYDSDHDKSTINTVTLSTPNVTLSEKQSLVTLYKSFQTSYFKICFHKNILLDSGNTCVIKEANISG